MINEIKVIALCGSMKFENEFREVEQDLVRKGFAVLTPAFFNPKEEVTSEIAQSLGRVHLKKITLADEIFVIDVDGYLGESTKKEIEFASKHNKPVNYYSHQY